MRATTEFIELYVGERGAVTIRTLSENLGLPLLTVIPAVNRLSEQGREIRDGGTVLPA